MSAMHQDDLVLLDIDNGVAILTLNNPSARNIVNMTQASVLKQRLDQVMAMRDQIKGMVLCAAGDHFMVGGDIHYFKTELQQRDSAPEQIGALIGAFNDAVRVLDQLPFPVVGLVQGAVAGAACRWPPPATFLSRPTTRVSSWPTAHWVPRPTGAAAG